MIGVCLSLRLVNISETTHPKIKKPVSYRRAIQLQVQCYKKCLLDGTTYEAFLRAV